MAMELGDTPDSIHPTHKQSLERGTHALGRNPAAGNPQALERHAAGTYKSIIQNLQRYGGIVPRNQRDSMRVSQDMFTTLQDVMQREQGHERELEQLAIETVLRLPEFKTLRSAVQDGSIKIEAQLGDVSIENAAFSDEEQEAPEGFDVPEIRTEYEEQFNKRKMLNTLTQGAAVANNYAYAYYSRDELAAIDPQIVRDYGKLMAYSEIGYFIQSPEVARAAAQAAGTAFQGGMARLRSDENGSVVIEARALVFPMLVQEIIKVCMAYLSHNDEDDPQTRAYIKAHSDFIDDEQIQMQVGPNLYRQLIDAIGNDAAETMPFIHDHLTRLPAREFTEKMKALIDGTPEGKAWFRQLAQEIKSEMEGGQEESLARRIIGH